MLGAMPPVPKYDYRALRDQFLAAEPPISIGRLCDLNDIPQTRRSSIQRRAIQEEWLELRDKRMALSDQKVIEQLSGREAKRRLRRMEVEDNAIEAIDEAISKMRADMKRVKWEKNPNTEEYELVPAVTYRPEQVVQLMDRIKGLFDGTGPSPEPEAQKVALGLNLNLDGGNPEHRAVAAKLIDAARGDGRPAQRAAGASPLPTAPGAGAD